MPPDAPRTRLQPTPAGKPRPVDVPEMLGHVRIDALLGEGGMGRVLRGLDTTLGRPIAVKLMRKVFADDPDLRERFRREATAAAALQHPHVVPVHFVGDHDGTPFLVMPLLKGESLAARLARGRADLSEALLVGRQTAAGLAAAHEAGLTHRDIKPDNLWLEPADETAAEPFRVLILDFGLARLASGGTLTATGAVIGTPGYMAPEQAAGDDVDGRADLFSLGCVLYEMTSGERPFTGPNPVAIMYKLANHTPPPTRERNPAVSEELSGLIRELMAKEPACRPATARDVAKRLAAIARTESGQITPLSATPVAVQEPTPAPPTWQASPPPDTTPARRPYGAWAAVVAGLGLLVAIGVAVVASLPPRQQVAEKRPELGPTKAAGEPNPAIDSEPPKLPPPEPRAAPKPAPAPEKSLPAQPAATSPADPPPPPAVKKEPRAEPPPLMDSTRRGLPADEVEKLQRAWADYLGVPVEVADKLDDGVSMAFVLVPPGRFSMGSPADEKDRDGDEMQHEVEITRPFYLAKYEVMQEQWRAVTGDNPSYFKDGENKSEQNTRRYPVETVSWTECDEFTKTLTKRSRGGLVYRLPTEAEWEYACRGGRSSKQPFSIGDGTSLSSTEANFNGNSPYGGAAKGPYLERPCKVGSYSANSLGLYDMHGNVWEWCADWKADYEPGKATDPRGPLAGSDRAGRGGGWVISGRGCRAASRDGLEPGYRSRNLGFRLAYSVPPVKSGTRE